MLSLWLKAFHIIAVICWFAGVFYLPRLFVNAAMVVDDTATFDRLVLMQHKLFKFTTPFMVLTVGLGLWLMVAGGFWDGFAFHHWLHAKLALVAVLVGYHFWMGATVGRFKRKTGIRSHRYYRLMNELPVLALFAIVIFVVVKPF